MSSFRLHSFFKFRTIECSIIISTYNRTSRLYCSIRERNVLICLLLTLRSSCGRADSVMDSHSTDPGFRTQLVRYTFYQASNWLPLSHHHKVERSLVIVGGQGRISRSGLTEVILIRSFWLQV